jgi:hypothetical protein
LTQLVKLYGADFGLLSSYFPTFSRKQIKRKYEEIERQELRRLQRMEIKQIEERRKNYFDDEILESKMIKWPKKPNPNESTSSSD